MKKLRILTISLIFTVALVGCSTSSKTDFPAAIMVDDTIYYLPTEPSPVEDGIAVLYENEWYLCLPKDDTPFDVLIDKTVLETGKEKQTTVLIDTELTDWSFTVQAEYGSISNAGEKSFDYSIPKDKDQKQDTITIQFSDKENKRTYEWAITLRFPAS